jgi:hypothetical protein
MNFRVMTLGRRMTPNLMFVNGFTDDSQGDDFDYVHIMMDRYVIDDHRSKDIFGKE